MKKPINKFAVALWVLAGLVLLGGAGEYFSMFAMMKETAQHDTIYIVGDGLWKFLISGLLAAALLASLGVIIELIDQIRWNALQPLQRIMRSERNDPTC